MGTDNHKYTVTDINMTKGEVVRIDGDKMDVKVLEHKHNTDIGETYSVDPDYFELVTSFITKDDLKNGDIVTLRNGDKLIYSDGEFADISDDCDNRLTSKRDLNYDLTYGFIDDENYDVIKVDRPTNYYTVFEREETKVKEMTIEEISKALGYKVKIIKEEK